MKNQLPKEIDKEIRALLDQGLYDTAKQMYEAWEKDTNSSNNKPNRKIH